MGQTRGPDLWVKLVCILVGQTRGSFSWIKLVVQTRGSYSWVKLLVKLAGDSWSPIAIGHSCALSFWVL